MPQSDARLTDAIRSIEYARTAKLPLLIDCNTSIGRALSQLVHMRECVINDYFFHRRHGRALAGWEEIEKTEEHQRNCLTLFIECNDKIKQAIGL